MRHKVVSLNNFSGRLHYKGHPRMVLRCGPRIVGSYRKVCVRLCSTEAPRTSATQPTRISHIIYQILKEKGPLTRGEIETELAANGMFDMEGHLARKRLVDNLSVLAKNRQNSIPSKPAPVPKGKLQPLMPETTKQRVLTASSRAKVNLSKFVKPTKEFLQLARPKRSLPFPSTGRIKAAIAQLRKTHRVEAKPREGQGKGRKVFVFRLKKDRAPLLTPDEYAQTNKYKRWVARQEHAAQYKISKLQEKKEAWAAYLDGSGLYSGLLDPAIVHQRNQLRRDKLLGLKA